MFVSARPTPRRRSWSPLSRVVAWLLTLTLTGPSTVGAMAPPRSDAAAAMPGSIPAGRAAATLARDAFAAAPAAAGGAGAIQGSVITGSVCGLGGACIDTVDPVGSILGVPTTNLSLDTFKPWDRVVKQPRTASAWLPLEFEARQVLTALHGVSNDRRLPHFAIDEIRAQMFTRLLGLAARKKAGEALLPAEDLALSVFADLVLEEKTRAAQLAIEEYQKWAGNPCGYDPPAFADPLPPDPFAPFNPGDREPESPRIPLGFSPYDKLTCQTVTTTFTGPPRPPRLEQFVAYGAGRASGAVGTADAAAAMARMTPAFVFAAGVSAALISGTVATILAASIPGLALGIAAAMGSSFAAVALGTVGGAYAATTASAGAISAASAIGVNVAAGPVAIVVLALTVTIIGTIATVEDESILPELQKKLTEAQQVPDLVDFASTEAGITTMFSAFMKQTFPDYPTRRVGAPSPAIPQARPASSRQFEIEGALVDVLATRTQDAAQETFLADGWFVTRQATAQGWGPWRWALSLTYLSSSGLRVARPHPGGFLDMPLGSPGQTIEAPVLTDTIAPLQPGRNSSMFVRIFGNRPPDLDPRSTDTDIVSGESITFVANATDPDAAFGGRVTAVRWFIEDPSYTPPDFLGASLTVDACGFDTNVDPATQQPQVCPWRPYDGEQVSAVFGVGGRRKVRVVALDNAGATRAQEFTVNVARATPFLSASASASSTLNGQVSTRTLTDGPITEGDSLDVTGVLDYPRLPEGYAQITRLSINWGDGSQRFFEYPCSFYGFGAFCLFTPGGVFTSGANSPWPIAASKVMAFRPDNSLRSNAALTLSAITDDGAASPVTRIPYAIRNISPTVVPFPTCDGSGLFEICDPNASDYPYQERGESTLLRGYINDVAAAAHAISVDWGDGSGSQAFSDCATSSCPPVTTPPNLLNFITQHPWKTFALTHTYARPGVYQARVSVNDGGPDGVKTYTREVRVEGVGALTGPREVEGGSTHAYTLTSVFAPRTTFSATPGCGGGTVVSWDGTTLRCQFPAVTTPTTAVVNVSGSYGNPATLFSSILPVTVQPTSLRITSLTGPTTVEQGRLVTYAYAFTAPSAALATTTFFPSCGPGSLVSQVPGVSFSCRMPDAVGPLQIVLRLENSVGQVDLEALDVAVVPDTTAPSISVPDDIVRDSTSNAGAQVGVFVSVSDAVDVLGDVRSACSSPEGFSVFPIGVTTVTCYAEDRFGNRDTKSFTVTILDRSVPSLTLPASFSTSATSTAGAMVTYAASAVDAVPLAPVVSCTRASGTVFPVGTTVVTCSATDAAGNTAQGSFSVTVTPVGKPALAVDVLQASADGTQVTVRFRNVGTGALVGLTVDALRARRLAGTGAVAPSTVVPIAVVPVLDPGQAVTQVFTFTVASTVTRFAISESGSYRNTAGATSRFSATQSVTK